MIHCVTKILLVRSSTCPVCRCF